MIKQLTILIAAICSLALSACSTKEEQKEAPKTTQEAEAAMKAIIKELAKDPESVEITNINPVFTNDSLVIIHCDLSAKNLLGSRVSDRMEYIYFIDRDKKYEALYEMSTDSAYVDSATWNKNRKGTFYADLDYKTSIRYLAGQHIMLKGRQLGDKSKEGEVIINLPTNTGQWILSNYVDEFGDKTDSNYILLGGSGTFSNSATDSSELFATIKVDKDGYSFSIYPYGGAAETDDDEYYMTKIKDKDGVVHEFKLLNVNGSLKSTPDTQEVLSILEKGGEISVSMTYDYYTKSTYKFKMNVDGFSAARKYLK